MKNVEEVIESANNYDNGYVAYLCNNKKMITLPILYKVFLSDGFVLGIPLDTKYFFDSNPTYVLNKTCLSLVNIKKGD